MKEKGFITAGPGSHRTPGADPKFSQRGSNFDVVFFFFHF